MNTHLEKAEQLIRDRLRELDDERKRLSRALSALSDGDARRSPASNNGRRRRSSSTTSSSKPRRRRGSGRGRRGDSAKQSAAVAEYLRSHPEASTAEVVEALSLSDGRVVGAQRRKLAASS